MMKVKQMINSNGNGAMNQFVIDGDGKRVFQSYASTIIEINYNSNTVTVFPDYNYSVTTGKHRNIFFRDYTPLGGLDNLKALEKAMKDGNYNGWTIKTA